MSDGRPRRAALVAVLAMVLAVGAAGPAAAQSVTAPQLQALAQRALGDPRSLAQLRAVQEVDGRPVDIGRALAGAEGPALASRLRALASAGAPTAAPPVDASEARVDARAVLDGRRFRPSTVPRPFAGILTTMGRWLRPLVDPLGRLWDRLADSRPAQLAVAAAVFVVAAAISARLVRRPSPRSLDRSPKVGVEAGSLDPDQLEREATAAERAGDLARAVRLRFVAGVLRLDQAGVISYRSSMTTGQLQSRLQSGAFAELATAFDEIAYGGRPAEEPDVRLATATWPQVLAETRR